MGFVEKLLIEKVLKVILKKFKLDKILKYVEEPNDADERIDHLEVDLAQAVLVMSRLREKIDKLECKQCKKKKEKWLCQKVKGHMVVKEGDLRRKGLLRKYIKRKRRINEFLKGHVKW